MGYKYLVDFRHGILVLILNANFFLQYCSVGYAPCPPLYFVVSRVFLHESPDFPLKVAWDQAPQWWELKGVKLITNR